MQLLYMWIKDYRCLNEGGLNFSIKYKFDFNLNKHELLFLENNELLSKFRKDIVEQLDFFSDEDDQQLISNLRNVLRNL